MWTHEWGEVARHSSIDCQYKVQLVWELVEIRSSSWESYSLQSALFIGSHCLHTIIISQLWNYQIWWGMFSSRKSGIWLSCNFFFDAYSTEKGWETKVKRKNDCNVTSMENQRLPFYVNVSHTVPIWTQLNRTSLNKRLFVRNKLLSDFPVIPFETTIW